jgi:hypothetical protein
MLSVVIGHLFRLSVDGREREGGSAGSALNTSWGVLLRLKG